MVFLQDKLLLVTFQNLSTVGRISTLTNWVRLGSPELFLVFWNFCLSGFS